MSWYLEQGQDADVVLSSRVRLARNLADTKFPWRLSAAEAEEVLNKVRTALREIAAERGEKLLEVELNELDPIQQLALVEHRLISRELAASKRPRALLLTADERAGVMVNEEDHLRIQAMRAGLALAAALEEATGLAAALEQKLPLAYDHRWGYLTTCPTNTGTGLRVSAMLHLPALRRAQLLDQLARQLGKHGFVVRGASGEGTPATCDMIQLSNQVTLGLRPAEIVSGLNKLVRDLAAQERQYRRRQLAADRIAVEDGCYRALALLGGARRLGEEEAAAAVSAVRLGRSLELGGMPDYSTIQRMFLDLGAGALQKAAGESLNARELEVARADLMRGLLATEAS